MCMHGISTMHHTRSSPHTVTITIPRLTSVHAHPLQETMPSPSESCKIFVCGWGLRGYQHINLTQTHVHLFWPASSISCMHTSSLMHRLKNHTSECKRVMHIVSTYSPMKSPTKRMHYAPQTGRHVRPYHRSPEGNGLQWRANSEDMILTKSTRYAMYQQDIRIHAVSPYALYQHSVSCSVGI